MLVYRPIIQQTPDTVLPLIILILPTYIPKIKNENLYASFVTGDFNGHSQFWWPDGDKTADCREIEVLVASNKCSSE